MAWGLLAGCGGQDAEATAQQASAASLPAPSAASANPATPGQPAAPNGSATNSATTSAASTATPTTTAASAPAAPGTASASPDISCGLLDFQAAVLEELNRRRAAGATCGGDVFPPAGAVVWNDHLALAAYGHSLDMASHNYFSHTSLNGGTLQLRVEAQAYAWSSLGENIAAGYNSVSSVVQGWMDSPGHCRNMMNASFTQAGMACSSEASSRYGLYYTLDLGSPR